MKRKTIVRKKIPILKEKSNEEGKREDTQDGKKKARKRKESIEKGRKRGRRNRRNK